MANHSFTRDVLDDPNDMAIIDSVIGLAHSFNRKVIAEGVETTEHGLMLLILGCHHAQGYDISRPMPSSVFQDWLSEYTPNPQWLSCGNKIRTEKENKIELFKLAVKQWKNKFENSINTSDDSITFNHWPILKKDKCHCGVWIKREKHEKLFEEKWIEKLEVAHDAMHDIATDLFNLYQKGQVATARDELSAFQKSVENMLNILGQSE